MGCGEGAPAARYRWLDSRCDFTLSLQMKTRQAPRRYIRRTTVVAGQFLLKLDAAVEAVCTAPAESAQHNDSRKVSSRSAEREE